MCTHVCVRMYVRVCVCVRVCACVYIYVCVALLTITIHYEIYDNIPVIAKWFTVSNPSSSVYVAPVVINAAVVELLGMCVCGVCVCVCVYVCARVFMCVSKRHKIA